jgi:tetratricopeptide (TPR) repeat protein
LAASAAVVLALLAASVRRLGPDECGLVVFRFGSDARLVCSRWVFCPPLLANVELVPRKGPQQALVSGKLQCLTSEGSRLPGTWEAVIQGRRFPSQGLSVTELLAADLEKVAQDTLSHREATPRGAWEVGDELMRAFPHWKGRILRVTVRWDANPSLERSLELSRVRQARRPRSAPVVLVGWDGADWELLDAMMAQGHLRNLRKLIARGSTARLSTLHPLVSPLIWTSIATGVPPESHGIFDFLTRLPDGRQVPITSRERRAPALWNILSALDIPVGVVAWWATWPAEPVKGFLATDRIAYQLHASGATVVRGLLFPPEAEDLLHLRVAPEAIDEVQLRRFLDVPSGTLGRLRASARGQYEHAVLHFARVVAATLTYHRITLAGFARYRPELLLVYVEGTDTVGHLFAPFAPPKQKHVPDSLYSAYHRAVENYYDFADELLGELLEVVGPQADIIVCSDHGFTWGAARPQEESHPQAPTAAFWHREPAILVLAGPSFRHLAQREEAHVLDIAPTILALFGLPPGKDWPGQVLAWALASPPSNDNRLAWNALVTTRQQAMVSSGETDAEIVEKLRSLGYLAGGPEPDSTQRETIGSLMNKGTSAAFSGQWQIAERLFLEATKLDPNAPGPWVKLAETQREQGKYAEALASAERALGLAHTPTHRELAFLIRGLALADMGKRNEAIAALRKATTELPTSFRLWNTLAGLLLKEKDYPGAYAALQKACSLGEDAESLNQLAALELRLHGNREKAVALWRRSLELRPDQPELRRLLEGARNETAERGNRAIPP